MVALRHHDHITVVDRHALIQRSVVGVNPLHAEPLPGVEAMVVGLLQIRLLRRVIRVVLVARVRAGAAFIGPHLHHQQTVGGLIFWQNIVHIALVMAFAPRFSVDILRRNQPCRVCACSGSGADCQLQPRQRLHLHRLLRGNVNRPRPDALERAHPLANIVKLRGRRAYGGTPGDQHQTALFADGGQRQRLPLLQLIRLKADISPAGAFRRNALSAPHRVRLLPA